MAKAQPVCRSFPREDDRAFRSCDSIPDYPIVPGRCLDEELCLDRLIVSPLLHSAGHLFDCLVRAFRPLKGRLRCNDYGNRIPYSAYLEAFSHLKIRLFTPGGAPNLEPRDDIWPTDVAPIIRANKNGAELIELRWGFPPGRPKAHRLYTCGQRSGAFRAAAAWCLCRTSMSLPGSDHRRTSGASPKSVRIGSVSLGFGGPRRVVLQPLRC